MNQILLFIGLVIILCLTIKPVGKKLPFPTLLIFIALGMLLGVNGPAHIDFSDYALTETVCSTALLFIMFYGGFNTNIDRAKPVAAPAVLLSTLGVIATAGITGAFAHFALGFDWIGGLLLGSVVASTDAASVFSVLREHNLSLKGGTDSLLEVESGSNDPVAYMLTAVLATLAAGGNIDIPVLLAKQVILGVGLGLAIGWTSSRLIERARATAEGAQTIFLFAVAIVAYALPNYLGGNGFLAVYLAGIVLGFDWIGGLLLGSVVASTDAASVFSVLREHSLSLRGVTDSLLEVESGSNAPVAYMLTAVLATLAAGGDINIPALLAKQIILGVGVGLAIGWISSRLIERAHATAEGAQTIFLFAVAIVAYALPSYLGGNGFLAVYLAGIVLGASDITGKVELAHFFDTLTEMAEMTIFFLLGLLVTPARLPQMLLPGLALMAFMLFVSRPIAVGMLLAPFKTNPRQVALVSWAGLRGAASVVFSLFAVVAGVPGGHDLFDLVFVIAV